MKEIASKDGLFIENEASRCNQQDGHPVDDALLDRISSTYKPKQISDPANDNLVEIGSPFILAMPESQPRDVHLAAKRLVDIIGASMGLALFLPVLFLIAGVIRLESGGAPIFRQRRTGLNGRLFNILKFRTMHVDGSRVTRVGGFLRKTSLDELPQLWNVLVGDMSLVGPRPHVPGMLAAGKPYDGLVIGYDCRHLMRPGLTGLAQSRGLRGSTANQAKAIDRILYDVEYIRNFSIVLDAKIIVRTIANELRGGTGS